MCNTRTHSESTPFDFKDLLNKDCVQGDYGSPFECLDHAYFVSEINKLISLRNEIELDRFHRRISNKDPTKQKNLDF